MNYLDKFGNVVIPILLDIFIIFKNNSRSFVQIEQISRECFVFLVEKLVENGFASH